MTDTTTTAPVSLRDAIAESLDNLTGRTRDAVIEHFAKIEADKRAKALIAGLDKLDTLNSERRRIKPTFAGYSVEGEPVGPAMFSKEQLDSLKKVDEQIEKLEKAIERADTSADFDTLYKLTK